MFANISAKRAIALLLAFVIALSNVSGVFKSTYSLEGEEPVESVVESTPSEIVDAGGSSVSAESEEVPSEVDIGVTINAEWGESEYKDGTAFNIVENRPVSSQVKLKVSYNSTQIRADGYNPGELIITVKGIGNVNRSGAMEALVGADKAGASVKTRDWSYTWNKANDTYTLTNNAKIDGNSVFSGYFELVWDVNARNSIDGYVQEDIQAAMFLMDGSSVQSEVLSFSNETTCDTFTIDIDRATLYSSHGVNGGLSDKDYVFIKYTFGSHVYKNSRGVIDDTHAYYFDTDVTDIGVGGRISYSTVKYTDVGAGCYNINLVDGKAATDQYIVVAYDRETYVAKELTAYVNHYGKFYDGTDNGDFNSVLLAEDDITFAVPTDFDFEDDGGKFHEVKNSEHEYKAHINGNYASEVAKKGGHIKGSLMELGTTQTFRLGFSREANTLKEYFSVELVDDFLYITQNNGNYRQLVAGDYEITSVVIPTTNTVKNENGVPIKSGEYVVTVFAQTNNNILRMEDYPLRPNETFPDLSVDPVVTEVSETVWFNTMAPIRTEPSADSKIVEWFEFGDTAIRTETFENYGWSSIRLSNGVTGYVFNGYVQTSEPTRSSDIVWQGLWMNYDQTIELPENVTTVAFRYEGMNESVWDDWGETCRDHNDCVCTQPAALVNVLFHLNEGNFSESEKANLMDGQVVNTMFVSMYDANGVLVPTSRVEEDYLDDDINIDLAQKDVDIYGGYLDRDKGTISFYAGDKNDYSAYTKLTPVQESGNKFVSTLTMGANFQFADDSYPNKFSLYSILPEYLALNGYNVEEDIWDLLNLSGLGMSEAQLAKACTAQVVKDYEGTGRTYIALHFDFGDTQADQKGQIRAELPLKVEKSYFKTAASIYARSAVAIDSVISEYPSGKVLDDGSWSDNKSQVNLFKDIDGDGDFTETLAYSFSSVSYVYADSSQFQLSKYVWTSYSEEWVQMPEVPAEEYGGFYRYKLSLKNGNNTSSNIVVKDILESINNENTLWQGTFVGVDMSEVDALGLTYTVWYSSSENPGDVGEEDWSQEMDVASVKAVAVDFGDSVLGEGQEINIIVNMLAPTDENLNGKTTENGFSASFSMSDSATGNETKYDSLESNLVQVKLSAPLRSIIITKQDEVNGEALQDAVFDLYEVDEVTDEVYGDPIATTKSNAKGYAIFHNIPANRYYLIREVKAPYGYETTEDVKIYLDSSVETEDGVAQRVDARLTITNSRKKGAIEVFKVNNLDTEMPVSGAEYTAYNVSSLNWVSSFSDFQEIAGLVESGKISEEQVMALENSVIGHAVTGNDGIARFENLEWGRYAIVETTPPDGYHINNSIYFVDVGRDNVEVVQSVDTSNVQEDIYVSMYKYVMNVDGTETAIRLPGATFELVRVVNGVEKRVGLYVTDSNGEIALMELPYGEYFFREYRTPVGYYKASDTPFTLSPSSQIVNVSVYNQRRPGGIIISKSDNLGNFVPNVEFTLYNESKSNVVAKVTTDEYGVAHIKDLEWGTYYLLETGCPDYYQKDENYRKVVVSASTLEVSVYVVNETKKGSVSLTKTDDSGSIYLAGAEYTLYTTAGSVVGVYTTNEQGQLSVEGLEWGSYYFKETKAPEGYGLSDELVRFSVNYLNCGLVQQISVSDPKDARTLTIIKRIKTSDINFDNGNPMFVFNVDGIDVNGVPHTFSRIITFDKDYVNQYAEGGYVSQSITISDLMAGEYVVAELNSSRFYLEEITDVVNGYACGEAAILDIRNNKDASVTFTNGSYERQDYSDSQSLTNVLKSYRKLTSIRADYAVSTVEAQSALDFDKLTVIAMYDDGSSEVLTTAEYTVSMNGYPAMNGTTVLRFPNSNGTYSVDIAHTDSVSGITKRSSFSVSIYGQSPVITMLTASTDNSVVEGADIVPSMFNVIAHYNDGSSGVLSPDKYIVSPNVAPSYEGDVDITVSLNLDVVVNEGRSVSTSTTIYVQKMPILLPGSDFNSNLTQFFTGGIVFTDVVAPTDVSLLDVSAAQDGSVVAWTSSNVFYVSSQKQGVPIAANPDSSRLFYWLTRLTTVDLTNLNTSLVTNMSNMFYGTHALTTIDVSNFDTSSVTNMSGLFRYCPAQILGLANWDTSSVTDMSNFFSDSGLTSVELIDLHNWDTSSVTNMRGMFSNTSISSFDVPGFVSSSVTDIGYMFSSSGLESFTAYGWDTSSVVDMSYLFSSCSDLEYIDISCFDTSSVTCMDAMFNNFLGESWKLSTVVVSDLWSTESVTSSENMFRGCTTIVGGADTLYDSDYTDKTFAKIDGGVSNPGYFSGVISVYYDVVKIGLSVTPVVTPLKSGVTIVDATYRVVDGCNYIDVDPATGVVTGLENGVATVEVVYLLADGSTVTVYSVVYSGPTMQVVFSDDGSLCFYKNDDVITVGSTYNGRLVTEAYRTRESSRSTAPWTALGSQVKSVTVVDEIKPVITSKWFYRMTDCTTMDLSKLNTSAVSDMSEMFYFCNELTSLDLSGWDTSSVTDMSHMFHYCGIKHLDLSSWNTSSVTVMNSMFCGSGISSINLSGWDVSSVTSMSYMFSNCDSLVNIEILDWDASSATVVRDLFSYCENLKSVDLSGWNTSSVEDMYFMFSNCYFLEYVNLSGWDTSTAKSMNSLFNYCSRLVTVVVSDKWSTENVSSYNGMLSGVNSLVGGSGTTASSLAGKGYDFLQIAKIDGGPRDPGLFTADPSMVINLSIVNECSDLVTIDIPEVVVGGYTNIVLEATDINSRVMSFKVNGEFVKGNSFTAPKASGTVVITDVQLFTIVCPDGVFADMPEIVQPGVTKIVLRAFNPIKIVSSFVINGQLIEGYSFTAPQGLTSVVEDLVLIDGAVIESSHNPYETSYSGCYGEADFANALYLTIELEYQMRQSQSYDYFFFKDEYGNIINNKYYGSTTLTKETIVIEGGYVGLYFTTNASYNEGYGFKATIIPTYPSDDLILDCQVDNQCPDMVTVAAPETLYRGHSEVSLSPIRETCRIVSFKLNGVSINGSSFIVPEDATELVISDVVLDESVTVESAHNPYPNSVSSVTYGEAKFEGATSLTVELTYQTESTSYDWVYLYYANGSIVNNKKYGGSTLKTETITVNGDYVKFVFRSDGSVNNYYGFKAVVSPNY